MRLKLLRRRLTVSAPRVAIRSALPWPIRWAIVAVVFGFCASIALWAFEFGKVIAGVETFTRDEVIALRTELAKQRESAQQAQSIVNTAHAELTAERAAREALQAQIKRVEGENQALRDDLSFFEQMLPANGLDGIAIRGLQAELVGAGSDAGRLKWQVLAIQPARNAPEFSGTLEIVVTGSLAGKPWTSAPRDAQTPVQMRQYRRLEGWVAIPAQVVVHSVQARLLEGATARATQTIKL